MFIPDKLKNRKRDGGTPEKSGTPSQDTLQDDLPPSRNVIWNEEIEKLQIKDEELQKVLPVYLFSNQASVSLSPKVLQGPVVQN